MSFLSDINTSTAEPSELALFTDPPNQVAVQKIYFSEIPQVTPVAADRALSDLKETVRNDEPHMPLRKTIKKNIQKKTLSRKSTAQGKGRVPPKGKKPSAKAQKGKKKATKPQKGKGRPEFPVQPIF